MRSARFCRVMIQISDHVIAASRPFKSSPLTRIDQESHEVEIEVEVEVEVQDSSSRSSLYQPALVFRKAAQRMLTPTILLYQWKENGNENGNVKNEDDESRPSMLPVW